jgi:hypothetical protein
MKSRSTIYCSVPLEFVQPWDYEKRIRQIKQLGLGNMTFLSTTFHVGNSESDRQRWKDAFPELSALIDATPKFPARPRHGMARILPLPLDFWIEHLRRCRELGLKVLFYPQRRNTFSPADTARLTRAGKGVVVFDEVMGEATSILAHGFTLEKLRERFGPSKRVFKNAGNLDPQIMRDWFLTKHRADVHRLKRLGAKRIAAIDSSVQFRLAMEVGVHVPIFELVPSEPYEGLSAVRGAARAYGAPMWGVHLAMGYYRAPTDRWTPERLRIACNLFYAGGASLFSEPNLAFQNWGSCSGFFTEKASPPIRLGEEECREFNDPICVRSRAVLAEHYRFTQFHDRPQNGPRVKLGFVLGHLDGWIGGNQQQHVWCVDDPAFAAGPAEQTWRHFRRMYDTEPWYEQPRKYYWQADPAKPLRYGTPPCGQLDIVPIEGDLSRYSALVFLGWNTMTAAQYAKLKRYVKNGGRLLMSVPHLSQRLRRDAPMALINDGDFSDLFGLKVIGPAKTSEDVMLVAQSGYEPYQLPVGTLYLEEAPLARVKQGKTRVLAQSRVGEPVLFEHRLGKGFAWLLAIWDYPGHRLDAFITDLLRTIADGEQDDIALEGTDVDYAVYDHGPRTAVYLVNKNIYGQPQEPTLIVRGQRIPIRLEGYGMRVGWLSAGLLVAPLDRFVKLTHVHPKHGGWTVRVEAERGRRRIELACPGKRISRVRLDGKTLAAKRNAHGGVSFECDLHGRHQFAVDT